MKIALRISVVVLAVVVLSLYLFTAISSSSPYGWYNFWQVPVGIVFFLTIAVFVLTVNRKGTRGSVLSNLGAALSPPKLVDPVEGVAQVVTASGQPRSGQNMGSGMCELNLVITVPGQPSVAVQTASIVKLAQWPTPGVQLPVLAERTDPTKFRIRWERVGTGWDVGMQQARDIADRMNAQASPTGMTDGGGVPSVPMPFVPDGFPPGAKIVQSSVTINGRAASAEEIASYETMTGMDLNGDGVVGNSPKD